MEMNFVNKAIRTSAVLTNSYVAATVIDNAYIYNQLYILAKFTVGSLTSMELKVEYSLDGSTYYQTTNSSIVGGTNTCALNEYTWTSTGNYILELPMVTRYVKISAKGTGTVTSSALQLDAILAVA